MNKQSKIVVTGFKGQLGFDCVRRLKERGYKNVLGIDIQDLDITDEAAVNAFFNKEKPEVLMHNAAWTAVDKAEENPELVYKVNALGVKYLAEACKKHDSKMVYISTDYVFSGEGERFYEVDDEKNGLSVYGKTKGQGEDFVREYLSKYFIVRISWVFGLNGKNFVKTMLSLADQGVKEVSIVNDQIGSVTYTYDLAALLIDMIESNKYGTYHATNEGIESWAEVASYIFKATHKDVVVKPISSEEFMKLHPGIAKRPLNSRLSKKSLDLAGFSRLPDWKDAINRYLKELEN